MSPIRRCAFSKVLSAFMAASIVLQPLAAYGATIAPTLAQVPLNGLNPVKPNIMFTMDDSGSMTNYYLPDYVGESNYADSTIFYCRDNQDCGRATNTSTPAQWDPPIASSDFNGIYYDPAETYLSGKRADGTDLAYEKAAFGTWTRVLTNPYANYPSASASTTINLAPASALSTSSGAYPDSIWCWKATTLLADYQTADTNGSVCRRNGRAYPTFTVSTITTTAIAAGFNYPNASNPPPGTCTNTATQKCQFTNRYTVYGYPYYYRISQVQFCSAKDANGWGTSPCSSRWDPFTYKYVRYGTSALTFDPAAFTRVDIKPVSAGGPALYPSGRTYAEEIDNFAKWYAFNRVRHYAMKAAGGIAFSALDQTSRVGFNTLNSYSSNFLNITDFTTANKTSWFTKFYAVAPSGTTPSIDATWRVGEYFSNRGTSAGLSGATDPLDPVTGKCQPNFHLLSTDGYWNQTVGSYSGLAGAIGNSDLTVPALPVANTGTGFTPGQPFPLPYREGSGANSMSNGMADVAMYYWIHDLRPTIPNQGKNPVAPWQHVVLYGLSIGARGTIPYATDPPAAVVWPKPASLTPQAIDDLWHAAVNSRGKYFNAQSPRQLAESVVSSLADFTDQNGTGAAVGIAGAQLSVSNQYAYKTSYESGWWGDVRKYALDIYTGVLPVDADGNPTTPPVWSAATQVDAQAAGTGWDANRRIVTMRSDTNAVVPFRYNSLSPAQQTSLNSGWTTVIPTPTSQSVLNYLRGDRSNEGVATTNFRSRDHILGDIVYSGAVPVGPPSLPYIDASNPGYEAYKAARSSRSPMVYVGANDGMVHVLDDTTTNGGKESWAYVPKALYSNGDPNDSAHAPSPAFQLGALTYRRGGIPLFAHKFYVNATPRAWDVDFANTNISNVTGPPSSGNDWRTIVVGGLGAGGRAVYALDATNPVGATDTEANVASSGRVLWEFTDANLGYVYDAPTLVKTYAYGWVALVVSGFNNPGGQGFLYVLNPKTGVVLKKLGLPGDTGTDTSPTGLSTIRAYVLSRKDPYVLQAYGGDIKGNVWRFDLSDPNPNNWAARTGRFARLTDRNNVAQPITTGVRIEIDQNNNVDRYLFVGTGKLLDQPDLTDTSVINSMYVIKDGTRTAPDPIPGTPYSRADLNAVDGTGIAGFSTAPTGRGWYQDAQSPEQKIVQDAYADVQVAVYAFSYPSSDPCLGALASRLFARDITTGQSVLESGASGTGGPVIPSIEIEGGIAGYSLIQAEATPPNYAPPVQVQVTTQRGRVFTFGIRLTSAAGNRHRVSWRLYNP